MIRFDDWNYSKIENENHLRIYLFICTFFSRVRSYHMLDFTFLFFYFLIESQQIALSDIWKQGLILFFKVGTKLKYSHLYCKRRKKISLSSGNCKREKSK